MTIKLGVAGTHSTGKTSFLNALAAELHGRGLRVERVADVAREARDLGFPILRSHTFESTLWIMMRGVAGQLEAGLHADVVLVDRPALDAVGYLRAALELRGQSLLWDQEQLLLTLAQHDALGYAALYRTQLDSTIPLGPGRDPDLGFREAAAHHIDHVFGQLRLNPNTVQAGPDAVLAAADEIERVVARPGH